MLVALISLILVAGIEKTAAAPVAHPPELAAPMELSTEQLIAGAASLGHLLYALDRGAWVASDALVAKVPQDQRTGAGGYVVETRSDQTLHVTFYRGAAATAQAFFIANVHEGRL